MHEIATIYIVDDDAAVRDSLRWVIESNGWRVETFASAEGFMNAYAQTPPRLGCLILDVRMPQMSGLELQKILNERGCVLPIIFITAHGTVPTAVRAMQAGAVDFLMKPFDNNALLDRIDRSVERARQEAVHRQQKVDVRDRLALLSTRESEVLALVVEGLTNKQIARKLAISIKTIETHRANIHTKVGATSLAELVRLVMAAQD